MNVPPPTPLRRALPFAAMMTLGACAESPPPPITTGTAPPSTIGAPVVYGEDDRLEWYELEDSALRDQSRDTAAALVGWGDVRIEADGAVSLPATPTLHDAYTLCADQRFRDQPTASFCSGTLIDDDLVLTAGHCIRTVESCSSNAFVFDYLYEADGQLAALDTDSVYRCVALLVAQGRELPDELDLAIVQLDRPVVNRRPATVSRRNIVGDDDALILQGFPNGLPLKVSTGNVRIPRTDGDFFTASIDAFHGDSGAGVRDASMEVIGVLTDGADDYTSAGSCAEVSVLPEDEAIESVMFAHHAVEALCNKGFPSRALCQIEPKCGDTFCTSDESPETCPDDCTGLFAVPDAWTCNHGWYAAGDDCDCACGAYDPDCDNPALDTTNCGLGGRCQPDGTCDIPIPEAWTCQPSRFNNGQQCDCDCGVYDPDCDNPNARVVNCAQDATCQSDGTCTASIPDEWTCRSRYYGTDDGCDCNCGAFDPDCANPDAAVYNCSPESTCLPDGSCEIPVPTTWLCAPEHYAANDGCDCRCGMLDPDCGPGVEVNNCPSGEVCNAEGLCDDAPPEPVEPDPQPEPMPEVVEPGPEPEPEPSPEVVEDEADTKTVEADGIAARVTGGGCDAGGGGLAPFLIGVLALGLSLPRRRAKA